MRQQRPMEPRQSFASCVRKVRYPTNDAASAAAERMEQKKGEPFHSYYCALCSGYHVGHKR